MNNPERKILRLRFLIPVYLVLLPVMFILPFYSAEGYSILRNTTSHLGAQNTPNAWIMNLTFGLLGIACVLEAWIHLKQFKINKILLTIFGLGLIGAAVFKHAPIVEGIPYSAFEDSMHSFFATLVGFSFTLFAFSATLVEKTNARRITALLAGITAMGLSALMFAVPELAGLWQRIIFILLIAWAAVFLEGQRARNRRIQ